MPTTFLPSTDGGLLDWARMFTEKTSLSPGVYGLSIEQAAQFAAAYQEYATQLDALSDPRQRTSWQAQQKRSAAAALKTVARQLAKVIDSTVTVTTAQKLSLGLTVRSKPTRSSAPSDAPGLFVTSVVGRTVKLRLSDSANPTHRGKARGALGAAIYAAIGADNPSGSDAWRHQVNTTRTSAEVTFPASVADGARVWFTAHWLSPRLENGPGSIPICTNLQGGAALPAS